MGHLKRIWVLFLLFLFIPGSMRRITTTPVPRLVMQIDVTCTRQEQTLQRYYTDQEKMSAILNYLRLAKDQGPAETDPERILGDAFKIVLHYSDGSRKVYYQRADRYLSREQQRWGKIDPEFGMLLYPVVEYMESDLAVCNHPDHDAPILCPGLTQQTQMMEQR